MRSLCQTPYRRKKTFARVSVQNFTECGCVGGAVGGAGGWAAPGTCGSRCGYLLWPFVALMGATCLTASLCQTPSFVIILRHGDSTTGRPNPPSTRPLTLRCVFGGRFVFA